MRDPGRVGRSSGHETPEPWLAPSRRHTYPGYGCAHQIYEYCLGWWGFDGVADHPEQLALAVRIIPGERVGPYVWDRVLGPIGRSSGLRTTEYQDMPYLDDREL